MTKRGMLWLWLVASGCQADDTYQVHELEDLRVIQGFPEPICGGTLVTATGVSAALVPLEYYWLPVEEIVEHHCPANACSKKHRVYGPLDAISHELVHGHVERLGVPRPWLVEGLATLLEDHWSPIGMPPKSPSPHEC